MTDLCSCVCCGWRETAGHKDSCWKQRHSSRLQKKKKKKTSRPKQSALHPWREACLNFGNVKIHSWLKSPPSLPSPSPKAIGSGRSHTIGPLQGEFTSVRKLRWGCWNPPRGYSWRRLFILQHLFTFFIHLHWVGLQCSKTHNLSTPSIPPSSSFSSI